MEIKNMKHRISNEQIENLKTKIAEAYDEAYQRLYKDEADQMEFTQDKE